MSEQFIQLCKVKNYFSLKSQTPLPLLANVVYQFKCLCDTTNLTYIGKTSRHLATRVKEHSTKLSAIRDHLSTCRACQQHYSWAKSYSIVESEENDYDIRVKEPILIKSHKPNLNKQLATNGTSFMLKIFQSSLLYNALTYVILEICNVCVELTVVKLY